MFPSFGNKFAFCFNGECGSAKAFVYLQATNIPVFTFCNLQNLCLFGNVKPLLQQLQSNKNVDNVTFVRKSVVDPVIFLTAFADYLSFCK